MTRGILLTACAGLVVSVATLHAAPSLHGSDPTTTSAPPSGSEATARPMEPYRDVVLQPDAQRRVVALAIRFSAGTAEDPQGLEGTAFLLGRLLEVEAGRRVHEYGASVEVEVSRHETLLTLVARPSDWTEAYRAVNELLYEAPIPEARLGSIREELLEILAFESGAPVRMFEDERARFLRGTGDPGARPPQGTPSTVELLRLEDLEDYRRIHLVEAQAVLAVTGPVSTSELETVVGGPVRTLETESSVPVQTSAAAPTFELHRDESALEVPTSPSGPPAWTVGERTVLDRQLTSTWIAVAFPFPQGTPDVLLDFIGHLILEGLNPTPPDPGLYGAEVATMSIDEAPVLVVTASIDPGITTRWEDRLATSMDSVATEPPRGAFFDLSRRRFRSRLLLDDAVPENRARRLARAVAKDGASIPNPSSDVWRLQRESVARAAAAAGPHRTLLYGPVEMMDR